MWSTSTQRAFPLSDQKPLPQVPGAKIPAALLQAGFWIPLVICTYLALEPEPPQVEVFKVGDVILHGAAFTYLTFSLVVAQVAVWSEPKRLYLRAFVAMLIYGLLLEAIQSFVPERSAELKDLLVDVLGIGAGLLLASLLATPLRNTVLRVFRGR
jgi:VanZ family protein